MEEHSEHNTRRDPYSKGVIVVQVNRQLENRDGSRGVPVNFQEGFPYRPGTAGFPVSWSKLWALEEIADFIERCARYPKTAEVCVRMMIVSPDKAERLAPIARAAQSSRLVRAIRVRSVMAVVAGAYDVAEDLCPGAGLAGARVRSVARVLRNVVNRKRGPSRPGRHHLTREG